MPKPITEKFDGNDKIEGADFTYADVQQCLVNMEADDYESTPEEQERLGVVDTSEDLHFTMSSDDREKMNAEIRRITGGADGS